MLICYGFISKLSGKTKYGFNVRNLNIVYIFLVLNVVGENFARVQFFYVCYYTVFHQIEPRVVSAYISIELMSLFIKVIFLP